MAAFEMGARGPLTLQCHGVMLGHDDPKAEAAEAGEPSSGFTGVA